MPRLTQAGLKALDHCLPRLDHTVSGRDQLGQARPSESGMQGYLRDLATQFRHETHGRSERRGIWLRASSDGRHTERCGL